MSFLNARRIKPRDLSSMRVRGEISRIEFEAIGNMQGRGLVACIDDDTIYFRNGTEEPLVEVTRGEPVAKLYSSKMDEKEANRLILGLAAAKYNVYKC